MATAAFFILFFAAPALVCGGKGYLVFASFEHGQKIANFPSANQAKEENVVGAKGPNGSL
jgi:hypothetical protein